MQQLSETEATRQVRAQNERIDEESHQGVHLAASVGNRAADHDVRLTAVATEQRLKGRQQCNEQGHTMRPTQRLDRGRELSR